MEIFQKSLSLAKLNHADKLKTKHTNKETNYICQHCGYIKYLTYFLILFDIFIDTVSQLAKKNELKLSD